MDIEISASAIEMIKKISSEYKIEPTVRIFVEKIGCKGASYGISFDEPKQFDVLNEQDGIEIVTDTEHMTKYTDGIHIDYTIGEKEGFVIKSIRQPVKIIECGDACEVKSTDDENFDHKKTQGCQCSCGGCNK